MRWALLAALPLALSGCLPQFAYAKDAEPVEKTVAFLEDDASVAAALGDDATVSLWLTKTFRRDYAKSAVDGRDRVQLLTKMSGSKGEAWLSLDATNIDEQGWAGTFQLQGIGKQVLRDGHYVEDGAKLIVAGRFAQDGAPLVAK